MRYSLIHNYENVFIIFQKNGLIDCYIFCAKQKTDLIN